MTFPAFKAGDSALSEPSGEFDSHTLPPNSPVRKSIQTLSDEDLVKEGKKLRRLSGDGKIVSTVSCAFDQQLKVCREEWRRRHPK